MRAFLVTLLVLCSLYVNTCDCQLQGGEQQSAVEETPCETPECLWEEELIHRAVPSQQVRMTDYQEQVVSVTDGVYVAIGYSISNMVMIEGEDGIVFVDSLKNPEQALAAHSEFRKITDKPLKAIILTHFHRDQIGGVNALIEANNDSNVQVIAHHSMETERLRFARLAPFNSRRLFQQFGANLFSSDSKCMTENTPCLDSATITTKVEGDLRTFHLIGMQFETHHTPGETGDHLSVWIPSKRVLIAGDNVRMTFPNLYAVRGTPARDLVSWYKSVGKLKSFRAEHLIVSHSTQVISGELKISEILTTYRDVIQFIHDQTVRAMNDGYEVDDIIDRVRIPRHLANNPFLAETYGTVEWSIRGIINSYIGWFDGYIDGLFPLTHSKKVNFMNDLLSGNYGDRGWVRMANRAKVGLHRSNHNLEKNGTALLDELRWSLQLSLMATEISGSNKAIKLTKQIIDALAVATHDNQIARNMYWYYINRCKLEGSIVQLHPIKHLPMNEVLDIISLRFKADRCKPYLVKSLYLDLTDYDGDANAFIIRNCILERVIAPDITSQFDISLRTNSNTWRNLLTRKSHIADAVMLGQAQLLRGTNEDFTKFIAFIDS